MRIAFRIGNRINRLPLRDRFEINRLGVRGDRELGFFRRQLAGAAGFDREAASPATGLPLGESFRKRVGVPCPIAAREACPTSLFVGQTLTQNYPGS